MKKNVKRLSLNRETLLRLENGKLTDARGAGTVKPQICCLMSDSCPPPPSLEEC